MKKEKKLLTEIEKIFIEDNILLSIIDGRSFVLTKKKDTYPPVGPYSDSENRYEVRYHIGLIDSPTFVDQEISRFNNKKEAIKYFNKMKRFEKTHEQSVITDEEKEWGFGQLIVKKVFGVYKVVHTVEKIK